MNMPRTISLVVAVVAGCGGNVNVVRQQKLELQPVNLPLRTFAFPSGLRVVVEKDTRTPLAGVFVVIGSGSSSDPKGKEGLAHYVEHLAFQSRPFGDQSFGDLLDTAGAVDRNAGTDFDSTTFYEIGPASALPELLRTEAVRMVIPVSNIPDSALAIERDVVRNELREVNETGFVGGVFSQMQAALFPPGHPNASPIGGTHQSVSSLTKADVEAFARAHYRPDNMTLVILGNVDLEKADSLLSDTLPGALVAAPQPVKLPERLAATAPPVPAPPSRPAQIPRVEAAIPLPELWVGWSMPRGFDRDGYLLSFLANAARDRFFRLRLDNREIVGIDVFPVRGKDASMLLCRIELSAASVPDETVSGILGEASKIVDAFMLDPNDANISSVFGTQYTFNEIAYMRARREILVGEILGMQNLIARGQRRAVVTHFAEDPTLLSRALRDLAELKPERFRDYARPYLTAERGRAVLFVPNGAGTRRGEASGRVASPDRETKTERLLPPPKERVGELLANTGQLTTRRLQNGVSVVLVRRPGLPMLSATVSLRVDPAAARQAGARALARAMAASVRINDASEYGGITSHRESPDSVRETVQGSSGNAEAVLATLAEAVRTPRVDASAPVFYKENVLPSYKRRESDPHRLADRAFFSALLPGSPYGHLAEYQELEGASPGDANDWIDRTHVPGNATLVVVGDFDLKQMQGFVDDSFGGWKGNASPAPPKAGPGEGKDRASMRTMTTPRPGATQGEVRFGCQLPQVTAGSAAVRHDLSAAVVQERLYRILREKLGASYAVEAGAVELAGGTAYLDLQTNVENGKLSSALRELRGVIDDLAAKPIDERTLGWARYSKASGVALSEMTNDALASSVLHRTALGFSPDLADIGRDLATVSAEQIQSDFQYCLGAHPTLSIVGEEPIVQAALQTGWR